MTLKALIHSTSDHHGRSTHPVWIYDTDKPRGNSERIEARFAAVRFLDTVRTVAEALGALDDAGIPLMGEP
jgi:hypothetical protein